MAAVETRAPEGLNDPASGRGWNLCRRPWWHQVSIQHHRSTPATSPRHRHQSSTSEGSATAHSVAAVARAFLHSRRRLRFDPDNKLYFPYEPGKQATSAVRIKNVSRSRVAFKFQTTAPKSCFMRPPNGILSPGESIIAIILKFIELPERAQKTKSRETKDKFKIVTLKVKEGVEYMPEMFEEKKEQVAVEQILRVVFLDPERPTPELEKLKKRIAEAEAEAEAITEVRKKPAEDRGPAYAIGDGKALDEWKQFKQARQQAKESP